MVSMDYLDDERKKLWKKIIDLETELSKRLPEDERDAKQASRKCSEYRNRSEEAKKEIDALLASIQAKEKLINEAGLETKITEIRDLYAEISPKKALLQQQIHELEEIFESHAEYAEKIEGIESVCEAVEENSSKVEAILGQIAGRKKEIDTLYFEIIGSSTTDSASGTVTEIKGKKADLQEAYDKLRRDFEAFSKEKKTEFSNAIGEWSNEFQSVRDQVKSLLPDALTAGLSQAYSEKKQTEKIECAELEKLFRNYVYGLVAVSLIPFGVSIYFLSNGTGLEDVILKLPRLVFSILPLYVPVLWVAYSANRKMNLSKRLIEEYTHKEVLSRTFEGLSTQIQNIKDVDVSRDLRTKLLYNILEVSSENPGKLISDYNKSDHPLMDALDKSVQLTNAMERLVRIPGMQKLAGVLGRKAQKNLDSQEVKVSSGLDRVAQQDENLAEEGDETRRDKPNRA